MSDKGLRYMPLHSNLVIFKCRKNSCIKNACHPLHSNLVIFKSNIEKCSKINSHLYIPIWFYSNADRIFESAVKLILYIPIWFYSNLISHFSSFYLIELYIPIWFYSNPERPRQPDYWYYFTFQSGSIQIGVTENASKEANRFTFQSGSIQMIQEPKDSKRLWSLYIPIWFYSNVKG